MTTSTGAIPGTSVVGTLPTTSTSGTSSSTSASSSADVLGAGMGKDTFLKLLVAQLKYQNPLSPTDGAQYMAQLAQFTQVEKLGDISAAQTDASSWQRAVVGEGMLGKTVTGADSAGNTVTDSVVGMQITDKGPLLSLKSGGTMDVSAVTSVTQSVTPAPATT